MFSGFRLCVVCAVCGCAFAGCGRKGPPLAPIVYLPRAVTELTAKRIENEIVLQFKVPTANTDNTSPADLDRIEVYAHTGALPAPTDFVKYGTLVQSIDIKRPVIPKPEDEEKEQRAEGKEQRTESKETGLPPVPPPGAGAGAATPGDTPAGVKPYAPELPTAEPVPQTQAAEAPEKADATRPAAPKQPAEPAAEAVGLTASPKQPADPSAAVAGPAAPKQTAQPAPAAGMIEQGWVTGVSETLTEKHREIGPMPPTRPVAPPVTPVQVETLETPGTVNFPLPVSRYYAVVGVSRSRHRRGPLAGPIRVPLVDPLQAPEKIDTTYTESTISLLWPAQAEDVAVPPGSGPGEPSTAPSPVADVVPVGDPNQETPGTHEIYADVETEGTQDAPRPGPAPTSKPQPPPTPRFGYNVYDAAAVAPDASVAAVPSAPRSSRGSRSEPGAKVTSPILPLNAKLLTAAAFDDPRVEFGTERCYVVRRVEMVGTIAIESAPSPPACVTPIDKFPPAAPKAVTSVASGTAVSLIWDANAEADLAGYLVLRGEAPDDKLAPLMASPITDASYVDTSVRRNRTYVYEVVAVDKVGNQSAPSNRVEEPIR